MKRSMKSIEYYSSNNSNEDFYVMDAEHDSDTGDFFYLGRIGSNYRNDKKFV